MDAVLNWVWQGSIVALALVVMLRSLERARANVRYVVCWVALLLVIALPAVSWLAAGVLPPRALAVVPGAVMSMPDTWWTSGAVMVVAWAGWASLRTFGFLRALVALRRARAQSRPFPLYVEASLPHWWRVRGRGRRAPLVLSGSVTAAAVLGCGRPAIAVAPSVLATLDAAELDRVLVHEWVHVQRRDDLVQLLQVFVRIVAGWHPAVWWIDRRLHVEREIACDEATVLVTGSPKVYAACLVKLAGLQGVERTPLAAPAVLRAPGLRTRVTRIVSRHSFIAPVWSRGLAASVVGVLGVVSFAAAGARVVEPAGLALPFDSIPIVGTERLRLASIAWGSQSSGAESARVRRADAVPPPQGRGAADRPLAPATTAAPAAEPPVTADDSPVPDAAPLPAAKEPVVERGIASPIPAMPDPSPAGPATPVAADDRTAWGAAADGGAALGQTSKNAGVATAGFFTRFARRVAGSL